MDILQIIKVTLFFKNVSTKDNVTVYKYSSLSKIAWIEIENTIRRRSKNPVIVNLHVNKINSKIFRKTFGHFRKTLWNEELFRTIHIENHSQVQHYHVITEIFSRSFILRINYSITYTAQKWSFPLRTSSVNVTKSAGNCGFGQIYWRNPQWKTSFLCSAIITFTWKFWSLLWKNWSSLITCYLHLHLTIYNLSCSINTIFSVKVQRSINTIFY